MPRQPTQHNIAKAVLDYYGRTYAQELDIPLAHNTPQPLFEMFCATLLLAHVLSANIAISAARALRDAGWTTPQQMANSTWLQRTDVLNHSGYARYDESTSRALGEDCQMLLDYYDGDLRKLRKNAEKVPQKERELLLEFKRIGEVGADIFFREVQVAWPELFPFADQRALKSARYLGLPEDARHLADLVKDQDFPRLVAGLIRVSLAKDYQLVKQRAIDKNSTQKEKNMPRRSWSKKDEDQYGHIKDSAKERGASTDRAEEIAARTVNKQRRKEGRTKNKTSQGTGNPNSSLENRSKQELYNMAKKKDITGRSKMDKKELANALRS